MAARDPRDGSPRVPFAARQRPHGFDLCRRERVPGAEHVERARFLAKPGRGGVERGGDVVAETRSGGVADRRAVERDRELQAMIGDVRADVDRVRVTPARIHGRAG